jgi:hypothetical protein
MPRRRCALILALSTACSSGSDESAHSLPVQYAGAEITLFTDRAEADVRVRAGAKDQIVTVTFASAYGSLFPTTDGIDTAAIAHTVWTIPKGPSGQVILLACASEGFGSCEPATQVFEYDPGSIH